jgi:uncharacterized spore protein YtfJ
VELNRLFDTVDRVQEKASVGAVFGQPTKVGEKTVFPIGRVVYGFGLGFGQGVAPATPSPEMAEGAEDEVASGSGGGGGGGLSVQPLAVLEVTPEATTLKPIVDEDKISKMVTCVIAWSVFWLAKTLIRIFGRK